MKTKLYVLCVAFAISFISALSGFAKNTESWVRVGAADTIKVKLYPQGAKTKNGLEGVKESYDGRYIRNVSDPEILVFLPAKSASLKPTQAVLVIPGGSYGVIAASHEGYKSIEWLNANGIAGILLKYRLPNGHKDIPLEDARQAMRIIREQSASWNINPSQIGVMGFSAGGHLASSLLTRYSDALSQPNFGVLGYPVIDLQGHVGTGKNLLGKDYDDLNIKEYSSYNHIGDHTPPIYIVLTDDDKIVTPSHSIKFYTALKEKGFPAEMHIYPAGNHGWWMRERYRFADDTYPLLMRWIKARVTNK
jgi:acetyl esterase/lipase